MILRVSRAFADLPDTELDTFAERVVDKLYSNPAYSAPPVTKVALTGAKDDFVAKLAAAALGGPRDTAAENASRQTLLGLLRQLANYVEGACNNHLETLLLSGFDAVSTARRSVELPKPTGLIIKNGDSGQLIARIDPVTNRRMYEGRASADGGRTWMPSVFASDSRRIIFAGLTPGTRYTIEVRALGGATGSSDWSDPITHMSM